MANNASLSWTLIISSLFMCSLINHHAVKAQTKLLSKPGCTEARFKQMDKNLVKMIGLGHGGRNSPLNKAELKTFCSDTDQWSKEFSDFLDHCYDKDLVHFAKLFAYSVKKAYKPICGKKETADQKTFLQAGSCINQIRERISCLDSFANKTHTLTQYNIGKKKINYACCNFVDLQKCIRKSVSVPCMSEEARNVLVGLIKAISSDTVNFSCNIYNENTNSCSNLKSLPKSKFDPNIKVNKQLRSVILTLLSMLESI